MRERRRYERVPFLAEARVWLTPDGPPLQASSVDLSDGGVGVFSSRMIEVGTRVEVSFRVISGDSSAWSIPMGASVRRCQIDPEGNRVAFEFDGIIHETGDPLLVQALDRALARETRAA